VPQAGPGAGHGGYSNDGGSYGGLGGGQPATTIYGSATAPVDLGSGGDQYPLYGGAGGGAIRLVVSGTLTNNGVISANGGGATGDAGGGSGGSVYVTTSTLAGAGAFTANGGSNSVATSVGNGGGGGRVAVYSASAAGFTGFTASTVAGGIGTANTTGTAPAVGTAVFFDTSVPFSNVSVYQNLVIPASVEYNSLTVAKSATVTVAGGAQVTIAQALHISGTLFALSTNNTTMLNGSWQGKGITIYAGSLQVDAGAAINADGQGYAVQAGPGAGHGGYTNNGGSYGGLGGGQAATTTYGSATAPVDLGSGGDQYSGTGGAGGGAIELLVSGTLTNNGVISANGAGAMNIGGAGSGGSIYVIANMLAGTGTFTANGGANPSPSGGGGNGGGGGRVAAYYVANGSFSQSGLTASGGAAGTVPGSAGTVDYVNAPTSVWVQPAGSVVHGVTTLEWFSDTGGTTTVMLSGPQTATLASGAADLSTITWDTTQVPDGAYELRLTSLDANGKTVLQLPKDIVVNNTVVWHTGTLSTNQEWSASQVQGLDGIVIVPSGVTLTIDPGTVVKALAGAEILVEPGGTLNALGTATAQVIFTTFDDSSVGGNTDYNQGVTVPTPGEWNGVGVVAGGTYNSNPYTQVLYTQTMLTGTLAASTTLLGAHVYEVTGTVTVPSGVMLNILPGSIVKFGAGGGINVQQGGTLLANGTLALPIYFTSLNDDSVGGDTNGNGAETMAAPGDWNSIAIYGATASFNHVQMQYGGGPLNANNQAGMIETGGTESVSIANSILAYSYSIGLQTGYPGGGDTVTVTNSTFYGNEDRAINAFGNSTVHVVNDTFDSNSAGVTTHGGLVDIANSVISNSTGAQFGGVTLCCGGTFTSLTNNDVYTTVGGVPNYIGLTDPTGTAGNLSANPVYLNGPEHDYRPTYGSPVIDAASGAVSNYPLTDAFGDPRYNDPLVTAKTGTPDSNGNYPDMGAFEFVQTAPSNLDLTVASVQGPSTAIVGTQVQVSWTVTNVGSGTVYGPWHDSVYLVSDPGTNPVLALAATTLQATGVVLGPGASYQATATVTVPGTIAGSHHWEVKTNVQGEVFEGANTANNTGISLDAVAVDLTPLTVGATSLTGSLPATGQSAYYKVIPAEAQATKIQLGLTNGATGSVQLFVGGGYVPSPQHYDYQQSQFDSASASLDIPSGAAQTYYVTVYAQSLAVSPATYSIQATAEQFSLTGVSPNSAITGGIATLTFTGGGFTANTTFSLLGSGGTVYKPSATFVANSDSAEVTFSTNQIPAGNYAAQATNGSTVMLANALTISSNPYSGSYGSNVSNIQVSLQTPEDFRAGYPSIVTLNYTNVGGYDTAAPLIYVSAQNATLAEIAPPCAGCDPNFALKYGNTFNSGLVLGISQQGPAGVLPAGASGSISFLATPGVVGTASLYASASGPELVHNVIQNSFGPCGSDGICQSLAQFGSYLQGTDFCASLVPPGENAEGFTRACLAILNKSEFSYSALNSIEPVLPGQTVNASLTNSYLGFVGFNNLLAADATALSASGIYEYDVQKLLSFEMQQDGFTDFNTRYHQGAFGFGTSQPLDITMSAIASVPTITYPDGSTRVFSTPSPTIPNTYLGSVGDYATVTILRDGSSLLTEADGTLFHFVVSGYVANLLDYIQDRNGNRTTLTYTNRLLTGVADTYGDQFSLQYDALGHIIQATDPVGRVTTYTYTTLSDTQHSTFLTSVTSAAGTTNITWNQGGPSGVGYLADSCVPTYCEPAIGIASIAYPDGTHTYYTYDAVGRLVSQSHDGGAQAITYTYNANGTVTATDALGKSTTTATSQMGLPTAITDPLGDMARLQYDPEDKPVGLVGALGDSTSPTYDMLGNLSSVASPDGNLSSLSHIGDQSLSSLTDPSGSVTGFSYDDAFDLLAKTYANGDETKYTYDSAGRPLTKTNRRGNTITYTYGSYGLLASKTYSNGSQVLYTYDNYLNLQTVSAAAGTTTYTYDAADRLTSQFNPDGTFMRFTYNAGGQRISMTDSTGFITNYSYDIVGRLSKLTNSSGAVLVTYTYDANGRIATKTLGNGTSTSLTYDPNGNPLSVINYSATKAVLSEYNYTYDSESRPVSMKSPSGTLSYTYDLDGQMTGVTAPSGNIAYAYDPSGNRTSVTTNGSVSTYEPNNLNEYQAAAGIGYQYDADGNVISGNGRTYTYNDENKLLTMVSATDNWSFQYDGLGNRVASVHNGKTTRYLIDSGGFGNLAAEFDGTGAVIAHYTYGLDLVSSVQPSGAASYYHFDGTGNTVQITNASGAIVNSYAYLPFGEQTVLAAAVANPFTYSGQIGVMDEGTGLYFMRNRWYNPTLGRFQHLDPVGLAGGENLYEYVGNSPLRYNDALGLRFSSAGNSPADYLTISAGFFLIGGIQVNLHTGETFLSLGVSPGGGANVAIGTLSPASVQGDRGEATSNFLPGLSYNASVYVGGGTGITGNGQGDVSSENGFGFGGHGGSANYAVSTYSTGVQSWFTGLNSLTNGALFGTTPQQRLPYIPPPALALPTFNQLPRPCGSCLLNPVQPIKKPVVGAKDPNGKITSGFGDQGFIPAGVPIDYTIYFENQSTATAPAQKVTVTDALPANLNWSTVQLSQIAFNNVTLNAPSGTQTYTAQVSVSTDPNPVNVSATLNPATGVVTWTMQSVDPTTGGAPANPLAGFLPPNNSANAGSGFVTFSVMPKAGLANATTIINKASIVFDANAAIATNTVTNTVDASTVTSAVAPLPASTTNAAIPVSWYGSDTAGSGIAGYNIYVAVDSGAYTLWLSATPLTSSTYTAAPGHFYSFFSLATNNVGLVQTTAAASQAIAVNFLVPAVVVTPSASKISSTQPLNVTITVSSTNTPPGTVTLASGSYTSASTKLVAGTATIVIPAGTLPSGVDTLIATYTPDTAGALFFGASSGKASVTVGVSSTQVTVGTSPTGAAFTVDGTSYISAQSFTWTLGSTHTLASVSPQTSGGTQQTFSAWSDGGAISHSVVAAAGTATYTASFRTAYLLTTSASPAAGGAVVPATGTYYPPGTSVPLTATPAFGYHFVNWTGAVANSTSATTTITLNTAQTVTGNFAVTPAAPAFNPQGGTYSGPQTVTLSDTTAGASIYYTTDGSTPGAKSTPYTVAIHVATTETLKAVAILNGFSSAISSAAYTINASQCQTIDYSKGFTTTGLTLNGGATVKGSLLQLTDGGFNEARSAFYSQLVSVANYTTDFTFQLLNPLADGITFTIQSKNPQQVGLGGGGLGYAGIPTSAAIKFDLFNNNGEGFDSTGLYIDGAYPSTPAINLQGAGILLHSGHVFAIHIAYGNNSGIATITDTVTGKSASASMPGDLTAIVGSQAYVGFTGGTGVLTATQNILTWSFEGGSGCNPK
jgi:RHS repeat-associated protein